MHELLIDTARMCAAGTWEDARDAYMHELLIRRTGHASTMAILVGAVFQKLFGAGAIDFLVRVDCRYRVTAQHVSSATWD
jgi:hypothetical protein